MSNSCDCGTNSACTCGCCEGIAIAVPQPTANRPGLPALAYRIGTHATFLETMIARLSSTDYPALAALTTRDPADPSIALLDSWAIVADVLTFYQERIANEGYLRTAIERRSILELANLIGCKLRPGVAATVYLAYTLDEDRSKTPPAPTETLIAAGSRSQSVPGPGQTAQFFETSDDLDARSEWNDLGVRLTQPQMFTPNGTDFGTDITTRDTIYFSSTATNLQPGDSLLLVLGTAAGQNSLRLVQSVEVQSAQNRTEVILQPPASATSETVASFNQQIGKYITDATTLFADSTLAAQVAAALQNVLTPGTASESQAVQQAVMQLTAFHDLAVKRNFSRLEPWLAEILDMLAALGTALQNQPAGATLAAGKAFSPATSEISQRVSNVSLARLTALLPALALPPSLQPPNSLRLARSVGGVFANGSDMAPRFLGAFNPLAAPLLFQAWANIDRPTGPAMVGAVRVKTGLFPGTYPGVPTVIPPAGPVIQIARRKAAAASGQTSGSQTVFNNPPTLKPDWKNLIAADGSLSTIALDSVYDKILAGSWIIINRPFNDDGTAASPPVSTIHKVVSTATVAMTTADGGFSAKVTQLVLDPAWLSTAAVNKLGGQSGMLPGTVVFAQAEPLPLAEEPLDEDIAGDTIELDGVYQGLESGRWIIISGERTDIENVTGVITSELVMILGVAQDTSANETQAGLLHTILTLANKLAYTYDRDTVTIYGNVVKATNGQTNNEILGNGDGSQSFQEFALKQKPLTFVPASNPDGISTTLAVYVNNIEWQETDTLAGLGPKDRSYVTQTADDGTTSVIFGNGTQGARLPTGSSNITAIYRNGIGQPGNVDATQISLLQSRPLNVKAVINPLRASGGADADSRDLARSNAPLAVLSLDRLVSVQDYADLARSFAGVGKASAAKLSDGLRDLVHVTIAAAEDIPIDPTSDLYTNLVQALRINGDPYEPLQVAVRSLRLLVISARVKISADYLWEDVAADVRTALLNFLSFDNRNLGQPVFQSEVISVMQAVGGVAYVNLQILDSVAESATAADMANLASTLALNDFIPAALARRNPSPANYPTDAILPAEVVYLTPTLPDTLILNQVKS